MGRTNYIAGAVLLAHSLQKHKSKYPLIILYTPSLPKECLPALRHEVSLSNAILRPTEALIPKEQRNLIAARFEDTWTKLRTFGLFEYERLVFLDADMLVFRSMDELFDLELPGQRSHVVEFLSRLARGSRFSRLSPNRPALPVFTAFEQ